MTVQRAVLDATLQTIASQGPDLVSMHEVARRAQAGHQAPCHHVGDRAGIFAAIAEEGFEILAAEFQAVLAGGPDPTQRCLGA